MRNIWVRQPCQYLYREGRMAKILRWETCMHFLWLKTKWMHFIHQRKLIWRLRKTEGGHEYLQLQAQWWWLPFYQLSWSVFVSEPLECPRQWWQWCGSAAREKNIGTPQGSPLEVTVHSHPGGPNTWVCRLPWSSQQAQCSFQGMFSPLHIRAALY